MAMMAAIRAPKQWPLTKNETITSFEAWRQNLQYTLSLDTNFAIFLIEDSTWLKKTKDTPLRGFTDDGQQIAENKRKTAQQKVVHLDLMLGQIANFCPVISRNAIVKTATSISQIWQLIRMHYGFQSTGSHFLDFNTIKLEINERPEDLYQRLTSFVEDNLLQKNGNIKHHDEEVECDEELSPSLENFIVLTWLRLVHQDLPMLVKQRYGTELRSKTIASIKPEISQALDSLLEELHSSSEAKILRTQPNYKFKGKRQPESNPNRTPKRKQCIICKQAGRPNYQHFLSQCEFLPNEDKLFMSRARTVLYDSDNNGNDDEVSQPDEESSYVPTLRRVSNKQSPTLKAFYNHYAVTLTIDTGAETSMIKSSVAHYIGASIQKSNQSALQADGITPLEIIGETHLTLSRGAIDLHFEALVVNDLDVDILAGIPFMAVNDISVRPSQHQIQIGDREIIKYGLCNTNPTKHNVRRTQAFVLRSIPSTVVWPGSYVEVNIPYELEPDSTLAIEPRFDRKLDSQWPGPDIIEAVGGKVRILNDTLEPQTLLKNDHFCQVRLTSTHFDTDMNTSIHVSNITSSKTDHQYSDTVKLDPDNILSHEDRDAFRKQLNKHNNVFNPKIEGYNRHMGKFEAHISMGPVQPPQRKGRVPQYSRDKLVELQQEFDGLEAQGVFAKPEALGITAEYINPSFLVKKQNGGHRLVTAFSDVGRYSKPQPSLMPDVDSVLRTIASWKYIIVSDLTSAFYQIPLNKSSLKYCGVATPFKGVRVYTKCAMGMPGSETALEELMCRVLGNQLQDGYTAKLADDLYCGGNDPQHLLENWSKVLQNLEKCNLHLSPLKTVICPRSTTILGWIWTQGKLSACPHKVNVLTSCKPPSIVSGLRSFIGAYKFLGRVLPGCSRIIAPLDDAIAGLQSKDKINWSDELLQHFHHAQTSISSHKSITLPIPSDHLWIVTDGSVSKHGIGATLYVMRNGKLLLAGFFSAKLRKHQITWLPCEIEALCIAAAVKHFSPYIVQSKQQVCLLTDSKPCVQAIEKLCRGEFSASPRITSFLSTIGRYLINVQHLAGKVNVPSDFASRNAADCEDKNCQICTFIVQLEDSVVRSVGVQDIINNMTRLPFTTRSSWLDIQSECPDLRRTKAHLRQGTRPSKKITSVKDIKRYLNVVTIARDGLLIVPRKDPLQPQSELIVVPRSVQDGLITALHIKLDHPSCNQLGLVVKRHFYGLDITKVIERVSASCHICASLKSFPDTLIAQSTEDPPEAIGSTFAADVIKRSKQLILVLRETVTSFTSAMIINNEQRNTLRDALLKLCVGLHPLDGPHAVIRVDPAPCFVSLRDDDTLRKFRINLEIGRVKNANKNPVAERCIQELESELLKQEPGGGSISELDLSIALARLNSRIRSNGMSSRELWTQRSQFTHEQLPVTDRDIIIKQYEKRTNNHSSSASSKHHSGKIHQKAKISVGDLVYLYSDRDKTRARSRYLVVSINDEWCFVKKFTGNQLRSSSYKVKLSECYRIESEVVTTCTDYNDSDEEHEIEYDECNLQQQKPLNQVDIPPLLSLPEEGFEPVSQDNTSIDISNDSEAENITCPIESSSRPKRDRHPPRFLSDYVTY